MSPIRQPITSTPTSTPHPVLLSAVLKQAPVMVGTVPIHKVIHKLMVQQKAPVEMAVDDLLT